MFHTESLKVKQAVPEKHTIHSYVSLKDATCVSLEMIEMLAR